MIDDAEPDEDYVSKSERKRQMHRLQELGESLTRLSTRQLDELPLSPTLREAINQVQSMNKREARRRQLQFIGKLMRREDEATVEQIVHHLEQMQQLRHQDASRHHEVEDWRDRIIDDERAIEDFVSEYPQADRQWLRQVRRQQQRELVQEKPPAAARKLFRYLRDTVES